MKGDARLSFLFSFFPRTPGLACAIIELARKPTQPTVARHPADCPSEATLHEAALLPVAVRGRLAAPPPDRVRAGPGEGRRDHRRARASDAQSRRGETTIACQRQARRWLFPRPEPQCSLYVKQSGDCRGQP